jgi:leucyl aminopeptidase
MITLSVKKGTTASARADAVGMFVFQDKKLFQDQLRRIRAIDPASARDAETSGFTGKERESVTLFPDGTASKRLILVGLGESSAFTPERMRIAGATMVKAADALKIRSLALVEPDASGADRTGTGNLTLALTEGILLASYRYDKYLTESRKKPTLASVSLITDGAKELREKAKTAHMAEIVCAGTYLARDLANAPPNEIYPETLAGVAVRTGKKHGFRVKVLTEQKIRSLGMGGLLAVSSGSRRPPRFIIMEHDRGRGKRPTVVLVGKGVTFDAGGISIKPAQGMSEMKMDMSGAAAVIGAMSVASRLKLPLRLIGLVPSTENLLGGSAMKPGDILTHLNGKTSEVDNTDAEGRLILADALSYAERYKPDLVVDLATLTGACVVALGHAASGMMGTDQTMMDRMRESGDRTYERVWQLPLFEEYEKQIKSDVADVKNVGGRWAGAITAALFLKKFIGDYKWIHIDIAGPAILEEPGDYAPKGGSGIGVRLLIDFLKHWGKH